MRLMYTLEFPQAVVTNPLLNNTMVSQLLWHQSFCFWWSVERLSAIDSMNKSMNKIKKIEMITAPSMIIPTWPHVIPATIESTEETRSMIGDKG